MKTLLIAGWPITIGSLLILWLFSMAGCDEEPPVSYDHPPSDYLSDTNADWSPDGELIVYRHEDLLGQDSTYPTGLYTIDPSGDGRSQILEGSAFVPAWSPNSCEVAFTQGEVHSIDLKQLTRTQLTSFAATFPSWSPDGTMIACARSGTQDTVGIWFVDLEEGTSVRFAFGGSPHWSPLGDVIVESGVPSPSQGPQIFTIEIQDSSNRVMLTDGTANHVRPKWSWTGDQIAWTSFDGPSGFSVWTMNSDGTNKRPIVDGFDPAWSPDSKYLVISRTVSGKTLLWKVRLEDLQLTQLTY